MSQSDQVIIQPVERPRHEFKHRLNEADWRMLQKRLRVALRHDAHVDASGEYTVRSLYFDTPRDRALREKINGVNHREKFRIRLYNGDLSTVHLERKSKHNGLCYKASCPLTPQEAMAIAQGDIRWMRDRDEPLLLALYTRMMGEQLRARTIIDYVREPFVYAPGNVRITLDSRIRSGLYATALWRDDLPLVPVGDTQMLLEVKYDAFLPTLIRDLVQIGDRRAGAYSKYAQGRLYG